MCEFSFTIASRYTENNVMRSQYQVSMVISTFSFPGLTGLLLQEIQDNNDSPLKLFGAFCKAITNTISLQNTHEPRNPRIYSKSRPVVSSIKTQSFFPDVILRRRCRYPPRQ